MKTAKEEAIELVGKYRSYIQQSDKYGYLLRDEENYFAKQCALIAVDRVIETLREYADEEILTPAIIHQFNIKKEIEKL
jgi:hypothetical protein